ncbi:MAG: TOBE domain-containing protein [Pirellulaceae bacterium]|jgi:molybdopterin-binding protein|nr:TOBE domain-containing protein [Pirellulaceae bacterium]
MRLRERHTLWGEVLSVNHSAKSCRIVIELKGTPESTAVIMKEATVEMGILAGAKVCAEVDATNIVLGVCHGGECALSG